VKGKYTDIKREYLTSALKHKIENEIY